MPTLHTPLSEPLVFLDFETTGLSLYDQPWDFAAIRREPDGTETEHQWFILHDPALAGQLPTEPWDFRGDYLARFDPEAAISPGTLAARVLPGLFEDRPHIVGAVPDFDRDHLRTLLRRDRPDEPWHYHLIDVETLAVGYLVGLAAGADRHSTAGDPLPAPELPWNSDDLSRAVGVEPPGPGVRHTALGDARWARDVYDAVMGSSR